MMIFFACIVIFKLIIIQFVIETSIIFPLQ